MKQPIFYGWWVIAASVLGMIVSQGPVLVFTFGIFMKPLASEFGWNRSQISFALTAAILCAAFVTPLVGRLIDRYGARQVAIPALVLFGFGVMSLALLPGNLVVFYAWFCVVGVLSAGGTPTPYAKIVTHWFVRKRGLALGLSMSGIGLGAALLPMLAQQAVSSFGWRGAYVVIGLVIVASSGLLAWKLRNRPADLGLFADNDSADLARSSASRELGYSASEALRSRTFWLISVAFFLAALVVNGCSVHLIPLLTDRGVSPGDAARIASVAGIALILGRVGAGWLLDHVFAPYLTVAFLCGPLLGIALLYQGAVGGEAVLCAGLIGLGVGAEVDLISYLTARYFGLRAFGEIYGYLFGVFCLGTAIGPLVMGIGQAMLGSYDPILLGFFVCLLVACGLILCIGRYPNLSPPSRQDQTSPASSAA